MGHLSLARLAARKAKQLSAQAAEMPGQPARGGPRAGGHNEARVVNEWQSTRPGRDTMAQTEQAARLTCSPLTVLTGSVLALASRSRRGRLFAFEFKFDFEDEGEDAPLHTQVETPFCHARRSRRQWNMQFCAGK